MFHLLQSFSASKLQEDQKKIYYYELKITNVKNVVCSMPHFLHKSSRQEVIMCQDLESDCNSSNLHR